MHRGNKVAPIDNGNMDRKISICSKDDEWQMSEVVMETNNEDEIETTESSESTSGVNGTGTAPDKLTERKVRESIRQSLVVNRPQAPDLSRVVPDHLWQSQVRCGRTRYFAPVRQFAHGRKSTVR